VRFLYVAELISEGVRILHECGYTKTGLVFGFSKNQILVAVIPGLENAEDFPRTKGAEDFPRTKGAEDCTRAK
jgi:hypothetical protein